jgi:Bacterial PH domain
VADRGREQSIYVARPHRVRVITIIATLALCLLTAVGWFLLPTEIRALFTLSQRLTLLGVLAVLVVGMVALASSYVRADPNGLRIRNGPRVHAVPWGRVHKIILRPGDPWALLLVTPEDGRPFEADIDAEKRQLMGIQAVDGPLAKGAVNELRRRHRRFLEATR